MRILMVGTRGVPARYGGFETAVEEVGSRLVQAGHEVVVFCRNGGDVATSEHLGMELVHLPAIPRRSLETLSHTAASVFHKSLKGADVAIVFNAANALMLPVVRARGIPVATHVDGLEWQRAKWGALGKRYYRVAESLAVHWSDALIADAEGIADYYMDEFGASTDLIAYGAPIINPGDHLLAELGLSSRGYHLVVARFEPENHVAEIVDGYTRSSAQQPLVVVGTAPYAEAYTQRIRSLADERTRLIGAIWDQDLLDQLYANSLSYLHGHSVGGTNPSLLRAAGAGANVIAHDVCFNREVVGNLGHYFSSPIEVAAAVEVAERDPSHAATIGRALQHAIERYNWDDVAESYEKLCRGLADATTNRPRRYSGRRKNQRSVAQGWTTDMPTD